MMDCLEPLPKKHWVWDSSDQMDISPPVTAMVSHTRFVGVIGALGLARTELSCAAFYVRI